MSLPQHPPSSRSLARAGALSPPESWKRRECVAPGGELPGVAGS